MECFCFSLALSAFCTSWSKLHSWDSPCLLALKPLFAVTFVKTGEDIFLCMLFLLCSDCPLAVSCSARLFQFTSAVSRLGLNNSTRTPSTLSLCLFSKPIVYPLQQHYALGVQLQTCLKWAFWGGGDAWGNTYKDVTSISGKKILENYWNLCLMELLHSSVISLGQTHSSGAYFQGLFFFYLTRTKHSMKQLYSHFWSFFLRQHPVNFKVWKFFF